MKDSVSNAKNHALRLIRYRDRSEKELSDRLKQKGFSSGTVSEMIELLKSAGLVNDPSLANSLEDIAKNVKFLGNMGTEFFLKKRGISENIISEMSISDTNEFERAINFIEKKSRSLSHYSLKAQVRKIKGLLLRRGYAFETVNRVIAEFRKEEDISL
ncbi:MAG: RecX family transcriptional regulator [Thermodesulfovibrionales bacterium]